MKPIEKLAMELADTMEESENGLPEYTNGTLHLIGAERRELLDRFARILLINDPEERGAAFTDLRQEVEFCNKVQF